MANKHKRNVPHHQASGKCKFCEIPHHAHRGDKIKKIDKPNVGEDVHIFLVGV